MRKLSILIFSKDDAEKAMELVENIYDMADEIVMIDSSGKKQHNMILKNKKQHRLDKLHVYYAVALGYPDPLRMYALSKCSNEWVLLIDTDERLSDELKRGISDVVKRTDCIAFDIKRYEGKYGSAFTWQTRLFRKSRVEFRGLLHEHAIVDGSICRIVDDKEHMIHRTELMKHRMYEARDYTDMRMFDAHPSLMYLPDIYMFMTSFSSDFLRSLGMLRRKRREWTNRKDYAEIREISSVINKIGIIKFLGLDRSEVIEHLNKKYGSRQQGTELLIKLLKNKHEGKEL